MTEKVLKIKKLDKDAELPTYAHDGDIGMDVKAISVEYDWENDVYIYHTGLSCETTGHMGVLGMMKSSIYKHGKAYLVNGVGLIDSDQYRGEILFIYRNRTALNDHIVANATADWHALRSRWYRLTHRFADTVAYWVKQTDPMQYAPYKVGGAVGQLVPLSFDKIKIEEVDTLSQTERGTGGFGSTDKPTKLKKKRPYKKKSPTDFRDRPEMGEQR